jgi:hypothetical protein
MANGLVEVSYRATPDGYEPFEKLVIDDENEAEIEVSEEAYLKKLKEINRTFQVLKDEDGNSVEIAIVNEHAINTQLVFFLFNQSIEPYAEHRQRHRACAPWGG